MNNNSQGESNDYDRLRELLLGSELEKIEQITQRLEVPAEYCKGVSEVLSDAVTQSVEKNDDLAQALAPTVEQIFSQSIKRDSSKFADALFPVIGPAIRKSIAETFRQMIQSLNQTLEQSFSTRGIKWRLESMRTGVPVAQIALLQGLVYRVEQVFLIHRKTGLLLQHVSQDDIDNQNADVVSSMLGAIGDFVGDSFNPVKAESLDRIEVGGVSIWIERGPLAFLAVAIRGEAPSQFRDIVQQTLESVHSHYSDALINFAGEVSVFDGSRHYLADCLQQQYKEEQRKVPASSWLILLLLAGLLLYWMGTAIYHSYLRAEYISLLEDKPGYVITAVTYSGGKLTVHGLRDPLAVRPESTLADVSLDPDSVVHKFKPYISLEPRFVSERALKTLNPPGNVTIIFRDNVLVASGFASQDWIDFFRLRSSLIPGIVEVNDSSLSHTIDLSPLNAPDSVALSLDINRGHLEASGFAPKSWRLWAMSTATGISGINSYDDSKLRSGVDLNVFNAPASVSMVLTNSELKVSGKADQNWIATLKKAVAHYPEIKTIDDSQLINATEQILYDDIEALEKEIILFGVANSDKSKETEKIIRIADRIGKIIENSGVLSRQVKITIKGHSDSVGKFEDNVRLSIKRARHIAEKLFVAGISPQYVLVKGINAPVKIESTLAEQSYNRRVTFAVTLF